MTTDTGAPRSRRALLVAGAGAAAAAVATTIGHPLGARATDGDPILVGGDYTATTPTKLTNTANGKTVLKASSATGVAVEGGGDSDTGVYGWSTSGTGVYAESSSGEAGLVGWGGICPGVLGTTGDTSTTAAVVGHSWAWTTAVQGYSGQGDPPPPPKATGVHGFAGDGAAARGVSGRAMSGRGVYGWATTGHGVHGQATSGVAGYFATTNPKAGVALRAVGRVKLDKCAGVATIAAGSDKVVVTPGIDLVAGCAVVATLQGSAGGTTTVHRCAVNAAADTFTIVLTANSTADVKVAWIVLG